MAQVTTRKLSELLPLVGDREYTPLLSAIEEIKNPISPRAVIAHPRIEAGYRDRGLISVGSECANVPCACPCDPADVLTPEDTMDWAAAPAFGGGGGGGLVLR